MYKHISLILVISPCYRSVCDRFNVGRTIAVRAVRRVTHAIFRRSEKFIQWPSGDRAVIVMRGFEEASGFPRAIGANDGIHIRINAPKKNPADYVNRQGFHSIQLQVDNIYPNAYKNCKPRCNYLFTSMCIIICSWFVIIGL